MARFNMITLEIRDLNEDMTISAMKRGLKGSKFTYSLDKILPQTYVKLLERAYKIFAWMRVLLTDVRQKEKIRKRSKRKTELWPNQVG